MIRDATLEDAQKIVSIYNHYIRNTIVSFEQEEISVQEMKDRISKIQSEYTFVVYEKEGKVIGYAYAGSFRARHAYRFTVEGAIYLDHESTGKGVGRALYNEIISRMKAMGMKAMGMKAIIGGISLPNESSVKLHEKCGFEYVGTFPKVGYKFDKWIDVAFYQKMLE
ncbi:hypothetical protein HDV01_006472 [Terramyces sp. JEL0728]|nr:hypothetical protein HDV01_006472 [Terramyces sp. JEL0728]